MWNEKKDYALVVQLLENIAQSNLLIQHDTVAAAMFTKFKAIVAVLAKAISSIQQEVVYFRFVVNVF